MNSNDVRLMIATPCYGSVVTNAYFLSMLRTQLALIKLGVTHEVMTSPGDSLISRARNTLVAAFMASERDWTHLLFIDADIEWQPEAVVRLLQAQKDVIAAVYPKKDYPIKYPINFLPDSERRLNQCAETGAVEVWGAATGFMMIRRRVIQRLMQMYPELQYFGTPALTSAQDRFVYALFDSYVVHDEKHGPIYLSEDYGFCKRWRDIGGQIWIDPETRLNHHGQHCYRGDVSKIFTDHVSDAVRPAEALDVMMEPAQ